MNNGIEKQIKELREALTMNGISDIVKGNILMSLEILEKQNNKNKSNGYGVDIKFINTSNNTDPTYAHEGDSGFDLRAFVEEEILIKPGQRKLIPTGLYFDIPEGYELQVRSRSGLSLNKGVVVLNSPGTVDKNYTGMVQVILINHGQEDFYVLNGDRIAQGVIAPRISTEIGRLVKVESIGDTTRGEGGFGSTGVK